MFSRKPKELKGPLNMLVTFHVRPGIAYSAFCQEVTSLEELLPRMRLMIGYTEYYQLKYPQVDRREGPEFLQSQSGMSVFERFIPVTDVLFVDLSYRSS